MVCEINKACLIKMHVFILHRPAFKMSNVGSLHTRVNPDCVEVSNPRVRRMGTWFPADVAPLIEP